ncbi:putative proteasome subunit alpha type-5 [Nosema granulosis]|uniref:Proteasome subunit alpha type n=1 Tax=Nosema granulosis TaxID=83296 RepID=A0A9P6H2A1_9MICR|nr:putative proteasome subunit alpha type-5 [Nosema granulosis]
MVDASRSNVNTYSPEGRLYQVEYAMKAMNLGTTTIGLRTKEYALLISEKKIISKLQNLHSVKKHFRIFDNIVMGFSGISGDAKTIVEKSRQFCLRQFHLFDQNTKVERLMRYMANLSLKFGENDADKRIFSRPFGVSVLMAGYDTEPRLFNLDPSGSYLEYKAKAIGAGTESVEDVLEQELNEDLPLEEAIKRTLKIIAKAMKEKINKDNVEVAIVTKDGVKILNPEDVQRYL